MAAFKENLVIEQGATFDKVWKWTVGSGAHKTAVDLTGCTARMQIREDVGSLNILHEMTTENGGLALGGVAGTVSLYISDVNTAGFQFIKGVYDIEIVQVPLSRVRRLVQGTVKISPNVTR